MYGNLNILLLSSIRFLKLGNPAKVTPSMCMILFIDKISLDNYIQEYAIMLRISQYFEQFSYNIPLKARSYHIHGQIKERSIGKKNLLQTKFSSGQDLTCSDICGRVGK